MRRILVAVVAAMLAALGLASPAGAAATQVVHFRYHGSFAEADWSFENATSFSDTFLNVSTSKQGNELFLEQFVEEKDAAGNVTTRTQTRVDVTSGFSFTVDGVKLATAHASGTNLPATVCNLDEQGQETEPCQPTTVDVNASWTGQGPISRSVSNSHFKSDGFSINDHFVGTNRDAVASGTVAGLTLGADELAFAYIGSTKSGNTKICQGTC